MHTHQDKDHQENSNSHAAQMLKEIQHEIRAFKEELGSLQQAIPLDLLSDKLRAILRQRMPMLSMF